VPDAITLRELAGIDVEVLRGVGDKRKAALAEYGIAHVLDLLTTYPYRWIDRTREGRVADLVEGVDAGVVAEVIDARLVRMRNGRQMVRATVGDDTGRLGLTFFGQAWRERQLRPGVRAIFFGTPERFRGAMQMVNPMVDRVGDRTGRIVPVYRQSDAAGVSTWELASLVDHALARCAARGLADPVPAEVLGRLGLADRGAALRHIHFPESIAAKEEARRRLAFDELLRVQLVLAGRRRAWERERSGIAHVVGGELQRRFEAALPFPLTGAQRRTIAEIDADLAAPAPMHRLLQGDVGSGKTVVAVSAMLAAVQGGHQGALMAPTEVLAEQHAAGVRALLAGLAVEDGGSLFGDRAVRVELLTGRVTGERRRDVLRGLAEGTVDVVIGTHALIQEGVEFASLGVVVIDEQHRFGVEQRAALRVKGAGDAAPDVLVMTATPIPRTAAMTVYGDLEVSVLDELPPGRTPIATARVAGAPDAPARAAMWGEVRAAVAAGRQAYVVCPTIEESEKLEVASAEETLRDLEVGALAGLRLGLLHGRMPSQEKEEAMARFRAGDVDVLVATTVIEVGVDVPNATCMVVLDADRFGIAQLHQLRGRVGRGTVASRCWLVTGDEGPSPRVEALVESTDGFHLAEVDLDLRGEGTLMNVAQKGASDLRIASLRRDRDLVERAREVAAAIVDADPTLERHAQLRDEIALLLTPSDAEYLFKS
jgi:ATP-dependent DNA helicase RecG